MDRLPGPVEAGGKSLLRKAQVSIFQSREFGHKMVGGWASALRPGTPDRSRSDSRATPSDCWARKTAWSMSSRRSGSYSTRAEQPVTAVPVTWTDVILQADAVRGSIRYGPTRPSDRSFGDPPKRMAVAFSGRQWLAVVVVAALVAWPRCIPVREPRPREGGARLTLALLVWDRCFSCAGGPAGAGGSGGRGEPLSSHRGLHPCPSPCPWDWPPTSGLRICPGGSSILATMTAALTIGGALLYAP